MGDPMMRAGVESILFVTQQGLNVHHGEVDTLTHLTEKASDHNCVDPRIDDPESWACTCLEDMRRACTGTEPNITASGLNFSLPLCMSAGMCNYPYVCPSWSSATRCGDGDLL